MCLLACPEVFQLSDEDGHAYVLNENVPPEFESSVALAVRSCPEQAIVVIGDPPARHAQGKNDGTEKLDVQV
jgi:ferredoxin